MPHAKSLWHWAVVISVCLPSFSFAQDQTRPHSPIYATAEEDLAAALVTAKTEEERKALLAADPARVTFKLVDALVNRGDSFSKQRDYERAIMTYHLAQSVAEQLGDKRRAAGVLRRIGSAYDSQGNYSQALESYNRSLKIEEDTGNKEGMARTLINTGSLYLLRGDYDQALAYYQRVLKLVETSGSKKEIADAMNNIGLVHGSRGEYSEALAYFHRSLKIEEEAGDKEGMARALFNTGNVYTLQGNYSRALEFYQKFFKQSEDLGRELGMAEALNNIGLVYASQGNYDQAMEYYQRSLKLKEAGGNKNAVASTLINIGDVLQAKASDAGPVKRQALMGGPQFQKALEYYQKARTQSEAVGNKARVARALMGIGSVHASQGQYAKALESFQQALAQFEISKEKAWVASALDQIGTVHYLQGDYAQALSFTERAAAIAKEIGSLDALWRARTGAGRAYRALHQRTQARAAFEEAITAIEAMRAYVAGGELDRQRFFENKVSPYHEMVSLLVAQKETGQALTYAERAKARVLVDVLQSGRVITKAMTPQEREREKRLVNEIVSLNAQFYRENLRQKPDKARLADLSVRLRKARMEREAFQTSLYAAHPALRVQRGEWSPVMLEEVNAWLPNAKTALLEYVVMEEKTYLFVVTKNGEGNQGKVDLSVYPLEVQREDLAEQVKSFRERLAQRLGGFPPIAQKLYNALLKPAHRELEGKTLVIVPDGVLWELPFQVLRTGKDRYLLEDCAIFYAPSLTALGEMVKRRGKEANDAAVSAVLLAVGNPAFGKEAGARIKLEHRDAKLSPLPEAEREVKRLGRLYGAGRSTVYVGTEAREERVKAEAGSYRVLHLATHGILNDASPMYSHLVLSQAGGSSDEDGLLEAWEIMNLDLKAELVVLSACETARGRVGAGEGVIGLTWALFVAGCPSTVVSQWKVDSASTTELMLEFHRNLLSKIKNQQSRIGTAKALREAALKLLRSSEYNHPFYWAGFVVMGDGF